jgi:hypothetical protein
MMDDDYYEDDSFEDTSQLFDDRTSDDNFDLESFGMAMTFGEMLADEERNPADLFDEVESLIEQEENVQKMERFTLKRGTATALAFEQYVYSKLNK